MQQLAPSPSQQGWPSHGLLSLWDMFQINAQLFYMASTSLARLAAVSQERVRRGNPIGDVDSVPPNEMAKLGILGPLIEISEACKGFGAVVTQRLADQLIDRVSADSVTFRKLGDEIAKLSDVFTAELQTVQFIALKPDMAALFERPQSKFSEEVIRFFPDTATDIDEAGRCFALGRHTACVFHLMRIIEVPLQHFAKSILPNDKKPNWDPVIKKIDAELKLPLKERSLPGGDQNFFAEVSAHMHAVKVAWRNSVMHVDAIVTEDRAKSIYDATAGLMNYLACRPDQLGLAVQKSS